MILAIRTDKPEAELYLLDNGREMESLKWQAHRELADTLLAKIKNICDKSGIEIDGIKGVIIFTGEGSFTGLRIGTSVANALGYSLNIPVVAGEGADWLEKGLKNIDSAKSGEYVIPKYNSEPNITKPKSN